MYPSVRTQLFATLSVCLLAGALCTFTTRASEEDSPPTRKVRYADLDLTKPEGAKALYGRIRDAAHRVCIHADSLPELRYAAHACIDKAIDDAVRHVNAPLLTQLRFGESDNLRLAQQ